MKVSRSRAVMLLKTAYVIAVIAALAWALRDLPDFHADSIGLLRAPAAWLFVLAWVAMACLLGWLWSLWLRWRFAVALPVREWLPLQAYAWAGRYLPGKVGLLAGKMVLAADQRLGWRAVTQSVLIEQSGFVFAGALVVAALLPGSVVSEWDWVPRRLAEQWDLLRIAAAAALVIGFVMTVALLERFSRTAATGVAVDHFRQMLLLALYAMPHVLIGAAFYHLLPAFSADMAALGFGHAIALLALAHVAGIAAVFAPAGLGVRELVLVGGLASAAVPVDEAILLAAVLRLLTLIADGALLTGVASHWLWQRREVA